MSSSNNSSRPAPAEPVPNLVDAWMNRCRLFVESVVVMVCPVLFAMALDKVNMKSEEHGRFVPITMLIAAAVTLITGMCPFLVCCFSKSKVLSSTSPHTVTKWLAPLSSTCLVALACWIIRLIISDNWAYPAVGVLIALCIIIRTARYCYSGTAETSDVAQNREYLNKLENSLEFSAGIAALLFVGLEVLALEGETSSLRGIQHLNRPMGASFVVCVLAVCLMLLQTVPPRNIIFNLTEISYILVASDILMAFEVLVVMFFLMYELIKLRALILLASPFLITVVYWFHVAVGNGTRGNDHDEDRPASLELTKVIFAGFLAVSIPSIRNGSLNKSTEWFLHLGAAAIASGLIWRSLTHIKSCTAAATANYASFFTHLCIAIATVPFTIMAANALS